MKSSPLPPRVPLVTFESAEQGFSFGYPQNMAKTENAKPLLLVQANNREAPTVLADAVASDSVKEAVAQSFDRTFATRALEQYTERNKYFAGRRGVAEKPTLFLGGQGLCSSAEDYERFCRMMLNRGELDGVRVLKPETVDLMFQNHVQREVGRQYGQGGAVDGGGGYAWGGANGTQFWLDRKNGLFAIFMVQTQLYRAPTYKTFRRLANESAGLAGGRAAGMFGEDSAVRGFPSAVRGSPDPALSRTDTSPASGRPAVGVSGEVGRPAPSADGGAAGGGRGMASLFKQRDKNGDGKLDRSELPAARSVLSAGETGRRMVN